MSWVSFLDLIADDISDNSSSSIRTALLNYIYPIGSVYSSYTSTSPATRFGGTWTAITGRFPYYNAGTGTGGSNTHTLTENEMPRHSHGTSGGWGAGSSNSGLFRVDLNSPANQWSNTYETGGGSAHNNMPAYQTLYAWRRTA